MLIEVFHGRALLQASGDRWEEKDKPALMELSFWETDMNKDTGAQIIKCQLISGMKKNQAD